MSPVHNSSGTGPGIVISAPDRQGADGSADAGKTGLAKGYIHGFDHEEQNRLYVQARVYEPVIFPEVDFSLARNLVEIGSGVGAQTLILHERYPTAHIDCVDASLEQVRRARRTLKPLIDAGAVDVRQADALHLPLPAAHYDGAYISWLLEHVQNPVGILQEARRVLRPGGVVYVNEVFHNTFHIHPEGPATMRYWNAFCDYQASLKGDPQVGPKLGNYLQRAGFGRVTTRPLLHQYDNRAPAARAEFIDHWIDLLMSGADNLLAAGRVDHAVVEGMRRELTAMKTDPEAVIFYAWILARGEVADGSAHAEDESLDQRLLAPAAKQHVALHSAAAGARQPRRGSHASLRPTDIVIHHADLAEEGRMNSPMSPNALSPRFAKVLA